MAKIHVLSQDTINQIAAGEVVERPMAVVKELVENAIDAQATAITVEIKDGGKELIRITDNGSGIAKEDICLAFMPHATSKIKAIDDLLSVSSLGFRGEALASIAAVSRLEMVTKTREDMLGYRYVSEGGEQKNFEEVGCPEGTTFIIRNLFFNTPARLKFLKSSVTETSYITSAMEHLALSHPQIAFRYIVQNQTKISTPGNGNLKDVIYHLYGKDITTNLIELHQSEVFCKVDGYLGKPVISRGNRAFMNYFINGRYIKSNVIHKAIEEAYSSYTMQHRYPFTVLHLSIDPQYIDVNVHPQKMEIRFTKEQEIFRGIYHAISQGLQQKEFIPKVSFQEPQTKATVVKERGPESFEKQRITKSLSNTSSQEVFSQEFSTKDISRDELSQTVSSQDTLSQTTKRNDLKQKPGVLNSANSITDSMSQKQDTVNSLNSPELNQPSSKPVQQSIFDDGNIPEQKQNTIRIVGQVFSTYWIIEYENSMYLIDQHAAHEKVLYERFMKQLREKNPMTQMVQPPIILTLSSQEIQALKQEEEIFKQLGFSLEPFGGNEIAVSGIPAHLPSMNATDLLLETFAMLSQFHTKQEPEALLDKIASMSCKAAVKGNQTLDSRQAQALIKELMELDNPYHCPHGRPTMIEMSKRELEKKFKRII